MSVLNIVHYGDPILRKKCLPANDFTILDDLLEDMFDTMYEEEGIGLAANQVGVDINLIIIDISHTDETDEPNIFINPEIIMKTGDKTVYSEGCLSLPGVTLDVLRPENVILRYQTKDEVWHEDEFSGLLSRAIQHEMDHLNGIFTIDRVSELDKIKYKKDLLSIRANAKKISTQRKTDTKNFIL